MTKKRAQEILVLFRSTIRGRMLNSLLPIHRALDTVTPDEFLQALEENEDLRREYINTKMLLRDMMISETISVYHTEKGQWAANNIRSKIQAIKIIIDLMDKDFAPTDSKSATITVKYE